MWSLRGFTQILLWCVQFTRARVLFTGSAYPLTLSEWDTKMGGVTDVLTLPDSFLDGLYYQCATDGVNRYSYFVNNVDTQGLHFITFTLGADNSTTYDVSPVNQVWSEQHQPLSIVWDGAKDMIYTVSFWDTPSDPRPRSIRAIDVTDWSETLWFEWKVGDGSHLNIGNQAFDRDSGMLYHFIQQTITEDPGFYTYIHRTDTNNPLATPLLVNLTANEEADDYPDRFVWHPKEKVLWAVAHYGFSPGLVKVDVDTGIVKPAANGVFGPPSWRPSASTHPVLDENSLNLVLSFVDTDSDLPDAVFAVTVDSSGAVVSKTAPNADFTTRFGSFGSLQ